MNRFLLIIMIGASIKTQGQQTTFSKVYYDSLQYGIGERAIVRSFDNGYIIAGLAAFTKGYILKLDSTGNFLWNKSYNNNSLMEFNSFAATTDSCFVLAGDALNSGTNNVDAFCGKIDAGGDTLWMKTYSLSGYNLRAYSVTQTSDSGYIMTGYATTNVAPNYNILVAKINIIGNLEWMNVISGTNNTHFGNSIKQAPDSNYFVVGYMENYPPVEPNAFLMKLSQSGSVLWTQKYNLTSLQMCSANDFVFTDSGIVCYLNAGGYDALMKTDFSGNILWSKTYNYTSGNVGPCPSTPKIHLTSDSGFVFVSGSSFGSQITNTDSAGNLNWNDQLFLASIDVLETANKEFFNSGNGPLNGINPQQVLIPQIGIIQTDSVGSIQACVSPNIFTPVTLSLNSTALTVTSITGGVENTIQPVIDSLTLITYSGCVDFSSGTEENKFTNDLFIFPNPSSGIFTITSDKRKEASEIIIYNIFGEEIYRTVMRDEKSSIDLTSYPKGIYFCRMTSKSETIETGKIIVAE